MRHVRFANRFSAAYILAALSCSFASASGQIAPMSPIFPTKTSECDQYSKQLNQYRADIDADHTKCLSDNKQDRNTESLDSSECSRSTCQFLHDELYGSFPWDLPALQKAVSACYNAVSEHEAEAQKRATEEAQRDAERRQAEAERDARNRRDREAKDAQYNQRSPDLTKAHSETNTNSADNISPVTNAIEPPLTLTRQTSSPGSHLASKQPRAGSAAETSVVDPFGGPATKRDATGNVTTASVVDPFSFNEHLVDPFTVSGNVSSSPGPEMSKAVFEASSKAIEIGTDKAIVKLDQDISYLQSQSGVTLNRQKTTALIYEVKDTESLLHAVNGLLTGAQYLALIKNVVSSESKGQRDEAWGEIVKQVTGDVLHSDLAKEGMLKVAPRLFGERVGLLLVGAAAIPVQSGAILLDSKKTDRSPVEVIHDTSGQVSLAEKQAALTSLWGGFERRQAQTNNSAGDQLKRELWTNSNIVYNECLESRADCEKWRSLLGPK